MKKIVAILLAITLMSALFIVPAHAHEVEETEIMPRAGWCNVCSQPALYQSSYRDGSWFSVNNCEAWPSSHMHRYTYLDSWYICTNSDCGAYNDVQQKTSRVISTTCSNS